MVGCTESGFHTYTSEVSERLKYRKESICTELGLFWSDDPQEEGMMKDIIEWIRSEEL